MLSTQSINYDLLYHITHTIFLNQRLEDKLNPQGTVCQKRSVSSACVFVLVCEKGRD